MDTADAIVSTSAATRTVRVVDRSNWGTPGPFPRIVTVTISTTCPVCGGTRGVPFNHNFYENGDAHSCDRWTNPCGHVDMYEDVLAEARGSKP